MNRKEFVIRCSAGCLGLLGLSGVMESCAGLNAVTAPIADGYLVLPIGAFESEKNGVKEFRRYVVAQNDQLEYPVCIYRVSNTEYNALWMKCTHQGTELQVFGDRLQCPAHGSEFTTTGEVQNGPADVSLRTFPVVVSEGNLKIKLA